MIVDQGTDSTTFWYSSVFPKNSKLRAGVKQTRTYIIVQPRLSNEIHIMPNLIQQVISIIIQPSALIQLWATISEVYHYKILHLFTTVNMPKGPRLISKAEEHGKVRKCKKNTVPHSSCQSDYQIVRHTLPVIVKPVL